MSLLRGFGGGLRALLRKRQSEREMDEELRAYVEAAVEDRVRAGMGREDALRQVRVEVGSMEAVKENIRNAGWESQLESLWQDVRYALRVLRKSPGFAAVAILTLALGIGATTAIFSVVDTLVLKPLPYPNAGRLVRIESTIIGHREGDVASYPDFLDWRARSGAFDGMAVFRTNDFTLAGRSQALHLRGAVVSASLFSLLGVTPALGRTFLTQEDGPAAAGGTDPVILSYGLWRREFGSDAAVLGRTVQLGNQPFTIVGVMPKGFQFPIRAERMELWTTIALDAEGGANAITAERGAHYLHVVGLLKPGVSGHQAQTEMVTIASVMNKQHPDVKPRTVRIVPEAQAIIGPLRTPLFILLGAVGFVLLIACGNVANLLLARATGRHKEMALRAALGASRRRTARQLVTESMALGLIGGGLGLVLALVLVRPLVRLIPIEVPRLAAIGLDARLLVFALLISLVTGLLFGLVPALQFSKVDLTGSLKEQATGSGGDQRRTARLREALVVIEVALAVVLLAGASLLIESFHHLGRVDPGFSPNTVLTFELDSPPGNMVTQAPRFFRRVVDRMRTLPGVLSASAVASLPLTGDNIVCSVEVEGHPTPTASRASIDFNAVEPGYFRTLGITLIAGRDFTERDDLGSPPVVIVNRALAQRFFPGQNPIGKLIRPGIANGYAPGKLPMREIIGVINNVKESDLGMPAAPEAYAPLAQCPFSPMFVVARTENDPRNSVASARRLAASLDKDAAVYHVETLDQYYGQSMAKTRFVTLLLGAFAGLALLLASLGVYGVISYAVARRRHEIGIRLALGAQKREILIMVITSGLAPALIGLAIGITGGLRLTLFLSGLLFGIKPTDPLTFVAVSVVLIIVALLACYIPARRAAHLDPMRVLRCE